MVMCHYIWMLGIKPGFSSRAASALTPESPLLSHHLKSVNRVAGERDLNKAVIKNKNHGLTRWLSVKKEHLLPRLSEDLSSSSGTHKENQPPQAAFHKNELVPIQKSTEKELKKQTF